MHIFFTLYTVNISTFLGEYFEHSIHFDNSNILHFSMLHLILYIWLLMCITLDFCSTSFLFSLIMFGFVLCQILRQMYVLRKKTEVWSETEMQNLLYWNPLQNPHLLYKMFEKVWFECKMCRFGVEDFVKCLENDWLSNGRKCIAILFATTISLNTSTRGHTSEIFPEYAGGSKAGGKIRPVTSFHVAHKSLQRI